MVANACHRSVGRSEQKPKPVGASDTLAPSGHGASPLADRPGDLLRECRALKSRTALHRRSRLSRARGARAAARAVRSCVWRKSRRTRQSHYVLRNLERFQQRVALQLDDSASLYRALRWAAQPFRGVQQLQLHTAVSPAAVDPSPSPVAPVMHGLRSCDGSAAFVHCASCLRRSLFSAESSLCPTL
jgi:hypothetical protein